MYLQFTSFLHIDRASIIEITDTYIFYTVNIMIADTVVT